MQRTRGLRRVAARAGALMAGATAVLLLLPPQAAQAHAFLTGSNPADGAVMKTAPGTIRLEFSESVVLAATHVDIVDSAGRHYAPTRVRLITLGDSDEEPAQVVGDLPALPRSAYRLSWQTLSADDLHGTSGLIVFGVNEAVSPSPFTEPTPRAEEAAMRWMVFLALALAVGGQLAARLYRRSGGGVELVRRCLTVSAAGALAGLAAAAGLLADQVSSGRASLTAVLTSSYGMRWGVRELGLAMLLVAALLLRRRGRGPGRAGPGSTLLIVLGAVSACVGAALTGHPSAAAGAASSSTLADAAHLGAAATWSGALLVIVLTAVTARHAGTMATTRAALRSFAVPAAACVSIMVVTGIYLASKVVGSVDAALQTFYGRTLLVKLGLVAAALGIGALNHYRLHRRRPRTAEVMPRRTVIAEAGLAVAVLGLAAVLTSGQPAQEPRFVAQQQDKPVPVVTSQVDDLQQSLRVGPNRPGRNVVVVAVFDTRRPAPAPIRQVLVSVVALDGEETAPAVADRLADGQWAAPTTVEASGRVGVRVTVQRRGLPDASHLYRWTVGGGASPTRTAVVSTAPIGFFLATSAAVLAAMAAAAWLVAWALRAGRAARRRREVETEDVTAEVMHPDDAVVGAVGQSASA